MIKVYESNETQFLHNGIKNIKATKAIVYKVDNGDYYLELECPTHMTENIGGQQVKINYADYLIQGNIVRVSTPWGWQGFRLNNPNIKKGTMYFKAKHLFFDSQRYMLLDVYPQNQNGAGVLDWITTRTTSPNNFTTSSDVETVSTARYVRKTLYEAYSDIVDQWGGHLERDNFHISLKNSIGQDMGVNIAYGKNMQEIEVSEIWDSVVTDLIPVGRDGILLPEIHLYSQVQYHIPYCKTVEFQASDTIDTDDESAVVNDLRSQAIKYLEKNQYPQVSYKLKAHLDNIVDIGDTINVKHERLNIDLLTNVISLKYDCIREKFTEVEFGNFTNNLKSLYSNSINSITKPLQEKTSAIQTALNDSVATLNKYLFEGHKYETENSTFYLNAKTPEESTKFLIISLGGIGFGTKELGQGISGNETYTTLWDINGSFNADCINTGTLRGLLIQGGTIQIGTLSEGIYPFMVDSTGKLIASNVFARGIIEATSGKIGTLNITSNGLQSNTMQLLDNVEEPIIWLNSPDGKQHANYQANLVLVSSEDNNGLEKRTFIDARQGYEQTIDLTTANVEDNFYILKSKTSYKASGIQVDTDLENSTQSFAIQCGNSYIILTSDGQIYMNGSNIKDMADSLNNITYTLNNYSLSSMQQQISSLNQRVSALENTING